MKQAIQTAGWFFLAIDTLALLFILHWALTASSRDGENAYALVFFLLSLALVGVGGGALTFSAARGSAPGLWLSTLLLGIPPVIAIAIRISNSL